MSKREIKSVTLILMILVVLVSLSCVSAQDTSDIASDTADDISTPNGPVLQVSTDESELGDAGDANGTFTDLANEIGNSTGYISLQRNYVFNSTTDGKYVNGILIDKSLTILGNDKVIDANGAARIFNITSYGVLLTNVQLINGKATEGGAIYSTSSELTIKDSIFSGNTADNGGAIYNKGTMTIDDTNFNLNIAGEAGGAVYSEGGLTVTKSTFDDNTAGEAGGAIAIVGDVNYSISDSEFTKNVVAYNSASAAVAGGAVYTEGAAVGTISGSTFTGNNATKADGKANGGAIKVQFGGTATIKDCVFTDNLADKGAAIDLQANTNEPCKVTVDNCTFTDNKAIQAGGAIAALQNVGTSDLTVTNSRFEGNTAPRGGAVYSDDLSGVEVSDSNFTDNDATDLGGAIYALGDLTVEDSNFTENDAGLNGGAIYAADSWGSVDLKVEGSTFTENTAGIAGGAICIDATNGKGITYNIVASVFNNNLAINTTVNTCVAGGAVYTEGAAKGTIKESTFKGNKAESDLYPNGGAIKVQFGGEATIEDCTFTENNAGLNGGAIAVQAMNGADCEVTVDNCTFTKNTAQAGAAISSLQSQGNSAVDVKDSKFTENAASIVGGAIYLNSLTDASVSGCEFTSNTAATAGNAIYNIGTLELSGNTISTTNVDIYSGGTISPINATVMNNASYKYAVGESIKLNATITDVDGNLINDAAIKFVLTATDATIEIDAIYNTTSKLYEATFNPTTEELNRNYVVGIGYTTSGVTYNVKTARLVTVKGTFTDLKNKIDNANGQPVVLNYSFAYTPEIDVVGGVDQFPNGIVLSSDVTIDGNGYTISASSTSRNIFRINSGVTAVFNNIIVTGVNGDSTLTGGAVLNLGDLTIDNCTFIDNKINRVSYSNGGAAVFSKDTTSSLKITDSRFINNTAPWEGSAGGAVAFWATSTVLIKDSYFERNVARFGGAVEFEKLNQQSVAIDNCTFYNNTGYQGGAVDVNDGAKYVNITGSTFDANNFHGPAGDTTTGAAGGAICAGYNSIMTVEIRDSIIKNNYGDDSTPSSGAGIRLTTGVSGIIKNCTFENNYGANYSAISAGSIVDLPFTVTLNVDNCTFINNNAPNGMTVFSNKEVVSTIENSDFSADADEIAIGNRGTLTLNNNILSSSAKIYNLGTITSTVKGKVLNGTTPVYADSENVEIYATATDGNGNLIVDPNFTFAIYDSNDVLVKTVNATFDGEKYVNTTILAKGYYTVKMTNADYTTVIEDGKLTYIAGTYTDLQMKIDAIATGEELDLTYDFAYDPVIDGANFPNGVMITKNLIINGNDHSIDGNNTVRIFASYATVTLNDIVFKNGKTNKGGAVYTTGNLDINNCTFIGNTATVAGNDIYVDVAPYQVYLVYDEASYNAAYNGTDSPLYKYYQLYPDEDKDDTDSRGHSWAAAISAPVGATVPAGKSRFPWIVLNMDQAFTGAIIVNFNGTQVFGPWNVADKTYGIISVPGSDDCGMVEYALDKDTGHADKVLETKLFESFFANNDGVVSATTNPNKLVSVKDSTFDANTNGYSIYNKGNLELDNNIIPSGIYNEGNLTSEFTAVVLDNKTVNTTTGSYTLNATLVDGSENLIYDPNFRFTVNGVEIADQPAYNNGIYTLDYNQFTTDYPTYIIGVNTTNTDSLVVKTGTVKNLLVGTFTDLQGKINAATGELNLAYDFAYNAEIDGANFPDGVVINNPITINGNGYTISGNNSNRIFKVNAATTLNNITFVNGSAVEFGGAIYTVADLTVANSTFDNNAVAQNDANGGAIMALAAAADVTLNINDVKFTNNKVDNGGGAIGVAGVSGYTLNYNIYDSVFENNIADTTGTANPAAGGAIFSYGNTVGLINNTTFKGNKAETGDVSNGGAIKVQFGGTLTVANSTFKDNKAGHYGGAISVQANTGMDNTLTVDNCTFEGNTANYGAAIGSRQSVGKSGVTIKESDFAEANAVYLDAVTTASISTSEFTAAEDYAVYNLGTLTLSGNTIKSIYNEGKITSTTNVTVLANKTVNLKYSEIVILNATYTDDNLNPIYDPNFNFTVAGAEPIKATYADGVYTATYKADGVGQKVVSAKLAYDVKTYDGLLNISKAIATITIDANETIMRKYNESVTIKLFDEFGNLLNESIEVRVNNGTTDIYYAVPTTQNGTYSFNLTGLDVGHYTILALLNNNPNYDFTWDTKPFEVIPLYANGTYTQLQKIIDDATAGETVILPNDITYDPFVDENNFPEGVIINKDITIDGNGTTIDAAKSFRIFTINPGVTVTITNLTMKNGRADIGGAILTSAGKLTLSACNFIGNDPINGSALNIQQGSVVVNEESLFENNTATEYGGAIYVAKGAELTVDGAKFKNNTAYQGGAIYSEGNLAVDGAIFTNNFVTDGGAAIAIRAEGNDVTFDINSAVFDNNTMNDPANPAGCGAVYIVGDNGGKATGSIVGSTFTNNSASSNGLANGGAIKLEFATVATIKDCTFTDNKASISGGAIDLQANTGMNPEATIDNCTFKDNKAAAGAAVAALNNVGEAKLTIINSTFENNIATVAGGAVYSDKSSKTTISNSTFAGNEANLGGAVYALKDLTVNENSVFTDNKAELGGAIYVAAKYDDASLVVKDTTFTNNFVTDGGAAIAIKADGKEATFDISNSVFDNNTMNDPANPAGCGAVYIVGDNAGLATGSIVGSTFTNNSASSNGLANGGAIKLEFGAKATIKDCTFTDNEASVSGGAIDLQSNVGMNPEAKIINCTFENNTAQAGGAIACLENPNTGNSYVSVIDSQFIGNKAGVGGAIYCDDFSYVTVSSSEFSGNEANDGGAIYTLNTLSVEDSNFTKNVANGGAAIFISDKYVATELTVDNCTFSENEVTTAGGAILIDATYGNGVKYLISDSEFIANEAYTDIAGICSAGGAIYTEGNATGTIKGSEFTGNVADGNTVPNGGAIKVQFGGQAYIEDSTFTNNRAGLTGGAIDVQANAGADCLVTVDNCTFTKNGAIGGGAIAALQTAGESKVIIKDSTFTENEASIGGAVYYGYSSTVDVSGSEFTLNKATKGAAIYALNNLTVDDSNFTKNTAEEGGAIYISDKYQDVELMVKDSAFTENNVSVDGGAIAIDATNGNLVSYTVLNSEFTENVAKNNAENACVAGGAFYTEGNAIGAIIGSEFTGNKADSDLYPNGGAIKVQFGGVANIIDSTFTKNSAAQDGGAIAVQANDGQDCQVFVNNCTFEDNDALVGGAISLLQNSGKSVLIVNGSTFTDNEAFAGGAIYFDNKSAVIINGTEFTSNEANNGGAIYALGDLTVKDSTFDANDAVDDGGAIYASAKYTDVDVVISGSVFTDNKAGDAGGAVAVFETGNYDLTYDIDDCEFEGNIVTPADRDTCVAGGAFYTEGTTVGTITNSAFKGNKADSDYRANGGAIKVQFGGDATITSCNFTDNYAGLNGGAISVQANTGMNNKVTINGCNFTDNEAGSAGGAISVLQYVGTSEVSIWGSTFTKNTADDKGGAIYFDDLSDVAVGASVFDENGANLGGAIYALGELIVTDSKFDDNEAEYGAAIFAIDDYAKFNVGITGTTFTDNAALAAGGAVAIVGNLTYEIAGCNFENNSAISQAISNATTAAGGAIYTVGTATGTIRDSTFKGNKAKAYNYSNGGAIKVQFGGTSTIRNCTFTENEAGISGGAISLQANTGEDCDVTVDNCTFTGNKAQAGAAISALQNVGNSKLTVKDSKFNDNAADLIGGAVYIDDLSTAEITDSEFTGNAGAYGFNDAIYNLGTLSLANNKVSNIIVNKGDIVTYTNVTVLDNKTYDINKDTYVLNATITDDSGNKIYDPTFQFIVNGQALEQTVDFNFTTGVYTTNLTIVERKYVVNATAEKESDLYYFIGILTNIKGTYTDLQNYIDNTVAGETLVLPYDFAYTEEIDGVNFPDGVVINKEITIEGNGSTISGNNSYRIFNVTAPATLNNITFVNGSADAGGAIYAAADLAVNNATFENNTVSEAGGAIAIVGDGIIYAIADSTFTDNMAINNATDACVAGGAIYTEGASVGTIKGSEFIGNKVDSPLYPNGGAIKVQFGGTSTIEDCTFIANEAAQNGGAIALQANTGANCEAFITNCTFVGNDAPAGGAISALQNVGRSTVIVKDSNFTANAAGVGGAIYFDDLSRVEINGTEFTLNVAEGNGGAIYALGDLEVTGSNFTANDAEGGAAIFISDKYTPNNLYVNDCTFTENTATNAGGAILIDATYGNGIAYNIFDSNFTANEAVNNASDACVAGGAIYTEGNATGAIKGSKFTGNVADSAVYPNGGAIKVQFGGEAIIADCTFDKNVAGLTGGAISVQAKEGANCTVSVDNCTFTDNIAQAGGAISALQNNGKSEILINDCTFTENAAALVGDAVYLDDLTTAKIWTSNFTDNGGDTDYAIYNLGSLDLRYKNNVSNIIYNRGSITSQVIATLNDNLTVTDKKLNDNVVVNATLTDGFGNAIYDPRFRITVDGNVLEDIEYNATQRLYTSEYTIEHAGEIIVTTSYDCDNIAILIGIYDVPKSNATLIVSTGQDYIFAYGDNVTVFLGLYDNETYEGLNANITVIIDSTPRIVEIINGTASFNATGFEPGKYAIMGIFDGNTNYNGPVYNSTVFEVLYPNRNLSIDVEDIKYGEVAIINITVTNYKGDKDSGTVVLNISGTEIVVIVDGNKSVELVGLDVGQYTINATLLEDVLDARVVNDTESFNVLNNTLVFDINAVDVVYPGEVTIKVNCEADGVAHVIISNESGIINTIDIIVENGFGETDLFGLLPGNYSLNATYKAYGYDEANRTANFTVEKANVKMEIDYAEAVYGEDLFLIVTILPEDATGTVTATIDNKTFTAEVKDGMATVVINGLAAGDYELFGVTYSGDDRYNDTLGMATIKITKAESSVEINPIADVIYGDDVNVTFTIKNETEITITVIDAGGNNVTEGITFTPGEVIISGLKAGEYSIYIYNAGDENHTDSIDAETFTVNKANLTITPEVNGTFVVDGEINVTFTLPADVNASSVFITIDGVPGSADSEDGIHWVVPFDSLDAGSHIVTVFVVNDPNYNNADGSVRFDVSKVDPEIIISDIAGNVGDIIEVNVTVVGGDATGYIYYDGLLYVIENGQTTILVEIENAGMQDIEVFYTGDDKYNNGTGVKAFNAGKAASTIEIDGDEEITTTEDAIVNITVGPEGVTGPVVVAIDGQFFAREELEDGVLVLQISGLTEGTHNITAKYTGDKNYNASEVASMNITVGLTPTFIDIDKVNAVYGDSAYIIVSGLPEDATGNVTATIGDKTFNADVEYGLATIEVTDLAAGEYELFGVTYSGDSKYNATSGMITLVIAPANSTVEIDPIDDVVYDADVEVTFTIENETEITITVYDADGNNITEGITFTPGEVIISGLDAGEYIIEIYNAGDENHTDSFDVASFKVLKDTIVIVPNVTGDLVVDGEVNITFSVPEDIDGVLTVVIDGQKVVGYTIENGTVTITGTYAAGLHTFIVGLSNDTNYEKAVTSITFNIEKVDPETSINASNIVAGNDATITVTVPNDTQGAVLFDVDGNKYYAYIEDGKAVLTLSDLAIGNHTVSYNYVGDDKYLPDGGDAKFEVSANDTYTIIAESGAIQVGDNATVTVLLPEDAAGLVFVTVDNETYSAYVQKGQAVISVPGLAEGSYTAEVYYSGDEKYAPSNTTAGITVDKVPNVPMNITALDVEADENPLIFVELPEDATGNVTVTIGNDTYTVPVEDGMAVVVLDELPVGNYTAEVAYSGDDKYESVSDTANFTVDKVSDTFIDADADPVEVDEDTIIEVTLPEDATGNVTVTIDGDTYNATVENGTATVTVPGGLSAGEYEAEVAYSGDDKYEPASIIIPVVVEKVPDAEINATCEPTEYGSDAIIEVTLPEDATGVVVADIDGDVYAANVENGTAVISVPYLEEGNYTAEVTYYGDEKYDPVSTDVEIEVTNGLRITAPNVIKYYHGPERFVVYTTDYAGNAIDNITVKITINGVTYEKTSKDGQASLGLNLNSGNYSVTVVFEGNEEYEPQNLTADVEILPTIFANDVVKVFRNDTQYSALFVDSEGNPLANTVVSFNINGVFYNKTTDESGVATLNINLSPGEYILTAINPVTGEMISSNVTVLSQFAEHGDFEKVYGTSDPYVVQIRTKDGNIAGAGEVVTFNINGVFYNKTTNETGHVSLNINLQPGEYIITGYYNDERVSDKITVRAA